MGARRGGHRGFTLLEALISIALVGMLFGAMLSFYLDTLRVREQAGARADRTALARQVLERMAGELRGCLGVEQFGFPIEQRLVGDRRNIMFLTTALPAKEQYQFTSQFEQPPAAQHDLREVGYQLFVSAEEETESGDPVVRGILRTEKRTLNQFVVKEDDPLQLRTDLWAPELRYLEFRYFDGVEWDTKWELSEGNPLPQLIQITVGYAPLTREEYEDEDLTKYPPSNPEFALGDNQPHPDRYSTIVRIPAADRFFSSRLQRVGQQVREQFGVEGGP